MSGDKLKAPQVKEMIRRYQAGETAAAIARAYGVSRNAVNYHVERAGVPLRGRTYKVDLPLFEKMLLRGTRRMDIMKYFDICDTTYDRLIANHFPHLAARRGKIDFELLAQMKARGSRNVDIARFFKVSEAAVCMAISRRQSRAAA